MLNCWSHRRVKHLKGKTIDEDNDKHLGRDNEEQNYIGRKTGAIQQRLGKAQTKTQERQHIKF